MSDHKGYGYPPAAGYGLYLLVRGLVKAMAAPAVAPATPPVTKPPIVTPPPVAPKQVAAPPVVSPPVVRWTGDRELLAWRGWRLGVLVDEDEAWLGFRLLSLSAPCIWDGPVARAEVATFSTAENPSGIYALKPAVAEASVLPRNELCWVTGTVALSGRVVEHSLGYRAECAAIRELRLGVGTHLVLRKLPEVRQMIARLEERYQAPVDAGLAEREMADRMLTNRVKLRCPQLPSVWVKPPWRLV